MLKQRLINLAIKSGGLYASKFLTRNKPRIFMYHNFSEFSQTGCVSAEQFEWQLRQIKRCFNVITLLELSNLAFKKKKIPANTIVLTIDDGYKNFYDIAFPLLKKYNLPATFFVASGFINGNLWLWPDQLKWLLKHNKQKLKKTKLLSKEFTLSGNNQDDWQMLNDFCLSVDDKEKYCIINELSLAIGISLPEIAPEKYSPCSWQQLKEMQDWGIEVGAHTISHPSLGRVLLDQAKHEIHQSLIDINQQLGAIDRTFCYPNGQPSDYNESIKELVEAEGYINAVTAFNDSLNTQLPYAWRRFDGGNNNQNFLKALFGMEMLGNQFRKAVKCHY